MTAAVEELLNSLSNKFAGVSSEIFAKSRHHKHHHTTYRTDNWAVDEMSRRIDTLEAALNENKSKDSASK